MTSIGSINAISPNARPEQPSARKSGGAPAEFQAVLDKADSRAKSIIGTPDDTSTDDTARKLAQLDSDSGVQLTQSEFDTGSASSTVAAGRLPAPAALFAQAGDTTALGRTARVTADAAFTSDEADADTGSSQAATPLPEVQQMAQQLLRQYQQVGAGTSSAASSGNAIDTVA